MKLFFQSSFLVLTLATVVMAGEVPNPSYYAAISFSDSTTRVGTANHERTMQDAINKAQRDCQHGDCRTLLSVQDGCIAIAFSYVDSQDLQWFGLGKGKTLKAVEALALRNCEKGITEQCQIYVSLCTQPEAPVGEEAPAPIADLLKLTPEGSKEVVGILKMVGIYNPKHLAEKAALSAGVAARLAEYKGFFGTLTHFQNVVQIGAVGYDRLLGFARADGWIKP